MKEKKTKEKIDFPAITITVKATPWAEGHVARFTSTRATPSKAKSRRRTITSNILP